VNSFRIEPVTAATDLAEWDAILAGAPGATVFHRLAWLRAAERSSGMRLHPLLIEADGRRLAMFPVFEGSKGPLRLLLSPPPQCAMPWLGPVLLESPATQSEAEQIWFETIDGFSEYLVSKRRRLDLVRITTTDSLGDARPFLWNGYDVRPQYTYRIPLDCPSEEVFGRFKKQLRTDARRAAKYPELVVRDGGKPEFQAVVSLTRRSYAAQGQTWPVSDQYLNELYDAFASDVIRVKVVARDEVILAGLILLRDGRTVRHWLGGAEPLERYIGLNELLHSRVIEEYQPLGYQAYELMGANTRRLCRHKSRYNPELVGYLEAGRSSLAGRMATSLLGALRLRRDSRGNETR
jgi:CelD/BcsL family acetyltransferase involved in cellulose biosynthesis